MTFPDDLSRLRCARVGDSYTCWIYSTCPLEMEGGYARGADERKPSLERKHVFAERFLFDGVSSRIFHCGYILSPSEDLTSSSCCWVLVDVLEISPPPAPWAEDKVP